MTAFTNKAGQRVLVSDETLRACLSSAITEFNANDGPTLLLPRKGRNGRFVGQKEQGWGGASERAIAHRLAFYLECQLRKVGIVEDGGLVVVDCEYNRHLDGLKHQRISTDLLDIVKKARRKAKRISDDSGFYVISVAPDIVVHQRGKDSLNLLVVEMKKKSNPEIAEYDAEKLKCFTRRGPDAFGYLLGFTVVAVDDVPPDQRQLALGTPYSNGLPQAGDYAA